MRKHMVFDYLVEIAKQSPKDIGFIKDHLVQSNRELFTQLLLEDDIKEKKKKVKKIKNRRAYGMLTIFDEPRLAAELAVVISKELPHQSVAVIDADRFDPRLDIYLNTHSYIKSVYTHLDYKRTTGLNLLIDACHKNTLSKQYAQHLAIRIKGCSNLSFFSGSYILDDYEYFRIEDFIKVMNFLRQHYDTVIVTSNKFLYDAFTVQSLIQSDCNIISLSGHFANLKERKNIMSFLESKQKIESRKMVYVLYDYKKHHHLDRGLINSYLENRIVTLPYHFARHSGIRTYPYIKKINRRTAKIYSPLLGQVRQVLDEFN